LKRLLLLALAAAFVACPIFSEAAADTFGSGANSFVIEFVTIGSPGNPPDASGNRNPAGAIPHFYRIGKYEISEQMVNNAKALTGLDVIMERPSGPGFPAGFVTWFEAAKFVNWLNMSTGRSPAYKFDSAGHFQLWAPSDPGYDASNLYRNGLAKYFLPSIDEWHKAAFYDPVGGLYYGYPTGSDTLPDGIDFPGDPAFDAVVYDPGFSPRATRAPHTIKDVGHPSPFGVLGQGGNADEWIETATDGSNDIATELRDVAGSHWEGTAFHLHVSRAYGRIPPIFQDGKIGFRIASVIPEPSAVLTAVMAMLEMLRQIRPKLNSKWS
jgi:hypothetical protein